MTIEAGSATGRRPAHRRRQPVAQQPELGSRDDDRLESRMQLRRRRARSRRWRRTRRAAASLLVVAAVIGASVLLALRLGHGGGRSDPGTLTSTAPAALLGVDANPGALSRNAAWASLASRVADTSTTSVAAVYGPYPPQKAPTAETFFVVAGTVRGGNGNVVDLLHRESDSVGASFTGQPGAKVRVGGVQPSVNGGEMQCVGAAVASAIAGECMWASSKDLVQLVTYTDDLQTVGAMTARVVQQLHAR